jgi:hypothetical protein
LSLSCINLPAELQTEDNYIRILDFLEVETQKKSWNFAVGILFEDNADDRIVKNIVKKRQYKYMLPPNSYLHDPKQ